MAPQKKDKEEAVLEAMLDLVGKRGFHNAPMSRLAKRFGASVDVNLSLPFLCYSRSLWRAPRNEPYET